jgi:hypothetical protein
MSAPAFGNDGNNQARTGGLAPYRRIGQQKAAPITGIEDTAP